MATVGIKRYTAILRLAVATFIIFFRNAATESVPCRLQAYLITTIHLESFMVRVGRAGLGYRSY